MDIMQINYAFRVAGAIDLLKPAVRAARLLPTIENLRTTDGLWSQETEHVSVPMVIPSDGKYYMIPLILRADDGEFVSIEETVVSLTKRKNIVKTQVVGGNGTVKELISDDDIDLNIITGIVAVDEAGYLLDEYPKEGVEKMRKLLDRRESLYATSDFLRLFEIDGGSMKIVVEEYSISQTTHTNRQVVNIKAVSDWDYTIFYEEN
jgi:hypothetical protein